MRCSLQKIPKRWRTRFSVYKSLRSWYHNALTLQLKTYRQSPNKFQNAKQFVVDNPDIANEQYNAVLAEATNTIAGGMQNLPCRCGLLRILTQCLTGGSHGQNIQGGGIGGILKNPAVTMRVGHPIRKQ